MFESAALTIGYLTMVTVLLFALAYCGMAVWVFFPARWTWVRDLPSHLQTPIGPYRLTALIGLRSRRKNRWFFGLMLMKGGLPVKPTVVSKKTETHSEP